MTHQHYVRPELSTFGSLRQITQVGFSGIGDGCTIVGPGITGNGSDYDSTCADARS